MPAPNLPVVHPNYDFVMNCSNSTQNDEWLKLTKLTNNLLKYCEFEQQFALHVETRRIYSVRYTIDEKSEIWKLFMELQLQYFGRLEFRRVNHSWKYIVGLYSFIKGMKIKESKKSILIATEMYCPLPNDIGNNIVSHVYGVNYKVYQKLFGHMPNVTVNNELQSAQWIAKQFNQIKHTQMNLIIENNGGHAIFETLENDYLAFYSTFIHCSFY